jgi:hypothetical protein
VQSSPDDVEEWQERLGPGGIWEHGQGDTSGLVEESLAVSTADVMSAASGTRATVASEADKAGTSTAPTTEDEGGDLCMANPLPTSAP